MKKICFPHIIVIICFGLLATSCLDDHHVDVSDIKLTTKIKRFDSAFFETSEADLLKSLPKLQASYPAMFTNGASTDFWQNQRTDELQTDLYKEAKRVINYDVYLDLENGLKHAQYYKLRQLPQSVYTYISRLDFDYPVLDADSLIFVATDLYLGPEAKYYANMAGYLKYERQPSFIPRDVLESVVKKSIPAPAESTTLLDDMITQGKIIYALSKLLPSTGLPTLLKYTPKEYEFCQKNERSIWVYFIENNMLFDSSMEVKRRFMLTAPFSKFRTDLDTESPGQIGLWVGYQIVNAYANNSNLELTEILKETDSRKILKISNYKP